MSYPKWMAGLLANCALLLGASAGRAQDWPQWRGPNRDSHVKGFTPPQTWPKALTEKWTVKVGNGVSSPVLVGDKVYAFGREGDQEVTTCIDAASGQVVWQDKYAAQAVRGPAGGYPGPRSTPAVADGKICTLGVGGVVSCLDAASGKVVWRKETGQKPQFYTSTSPLIADGKVVVYLGALTALDLATGEQKWRWAGGSTPYGSPVLMTVGGVKQVVTPSGNSVVGVGLDDGKLLWQFKFKGSGYASTYDTPILDGDTVIYVAPGGRRGVGSTLAFKVQKTSDGFTATEVWQTKQLAYMYNTPVLRDGLLFGLSMDKKFFCADAKTGKELWKDATARGEAGGVLSAGPVMVALTGDSHLTVFRPSAKGYEEVARYRVSATSGLPYPILAGNRVYVKGRDSLTLWTLD